MARIRTIKPEFFRHERLFEAEKSSGLPLRIAFAGLWTVADREGRFKWEPRSLKLDCLPYDEVDFELVLQAFAANGFVLAYNVDGKDYGVIPSWKSHQVINTREAKSVIPAPPTDLSSTTHARTVIPVHTPNGINVPEPLRQTIMARDKACLRCSATDDLTVDHIFPRSMGGTHAITNLRTLCRACNSARPVAGQALIDDLARDGLTLNDMSRTCMHVQDQGEGKGKEGKGKECSEAKASAPIGAGKVEEVMEADVYRYGRKVLGKSAGGVITELRKFCKGDWRAVMDLLEQAEPKAAPMEWIQGVLRGTEGAKIPDHQLFPTEIYENVL